MLELDQGASRLAAAGEIAHIRDFEETDPPDAFDGADGPSGHTILRLVRKPPSFRLKVSATVAVASAVSASQ
jgi:hypothetical protein